MRGNRKSAADKSNQSSKIYKINTKQQTPAQRFSVQHLYVFPSFATVTCTTWAVDLLGVCATTVYNVVNKGVSSHTQNDKIHLWSLSHESS